MNCASQDHFPLLSPAGSSGLPKSTPPAHLWNQVRAVALESLLQVEYFWISANIILDRSLILDFHRDHPIHHVP